MGDNFFENTMAHKWFQTKYEGIRFREHPSRMFGIRKDRYFVVRYRVDGTRKEEALGWESQNDSRDKDGSKITMLEVARATLAKLKEAHRTGEGPGTLADQRHQAALAKEEVERQREIEKIKNVTLAEYWPIYLTSAKLLKDETKKKAKSWQVDEGIFKNWLEPILGDTPIKNIDVDQWDRLMGATVDAGLSPRTRQYIAMVLRQCLGHAYTRKLIPNPPPAARDVGATIGKGGNRRTRALSTPELQAILRGLAERDALAYSLTYFCALTACRFSEAANLEWKNIDLAVGQATFQNTKNGTHRTIPLPPSLIKHLSELRSLGRITGSVFLNCTGKPYTQPPQPFRDVVEALGLNEGREKRDRVVFHTLRHTAATRLAQAGTSLPDLQALGGWKSPIMALRYAHDDDKSKRQAMAALDTMASAESPGILELFGDQSLSKTK
jgi:integrase